MALTSSIKKLRYQLDTFIAKGGHNIFVGLFLFFIINLIAIAALRGILIWLLPEEVGADAEGGFLRQMFVIFLEMTDPGNMNMDLDSNVGYKAVAILAGVSGVVVFSAVIAVITTALEEKITELKKGHSSVVETGHTLILGWNDRVTEVINELLIANESEPDPCIVILSEHEKEEMDDHLKLRLPDTKNTRLVTRSGVASSLGNLELVSLATCKSVIVLGHCTDSSSTQERDTSDTLVIKTILGVIASQPDDTDVPVVAEVFAARNREIVADVSRGRVITFDTLDILARVLVQTSRSNGLSVVYSEILSFDGCEMYFHRGNWEECPFGRIQFHFIDGVPLGIRRSDGELLINPATETPVRPGDDLLILAEDDSTIRYENKAVVTPSDLQPTDQRNQARQERELIIGWNPKTATIISEYDDYVMEGSRIELFINNSDSAIEKAVKELQTTLKHVELELHTRELLNSQTYSRLDLSGYDNILVLSQGGKDVDPEMTDSETIIILLLVRNLLDALPKDQPKPKLITEVMDSKNHELVARAGVNDFIISNRLMSMLAAQVSEEPDVLHVYNQLFDVGGSEIYLKPLKLYFESFPAEATFADLMAVAQNRGETCIGIKINKYQRNIDRNYGIKLIPEKNTSYTLEPDDHIVVLATDES